MIRLATGRNRRSNGRALLRTSLNTGIFMRPRPGLATTLLLASTLAIGAGEEPLPRSTEASATLTWDGSVVAAGDRAGASAGRTLLDLGIETDLERAFGWRGARAFVGVLGFRGADGASLAGEHQSHSSIDAGAFETAVAWFEQTVAHERFRVRIGRMDANDEFGVTEAAEPFLNASAGLSPSLCGLPSYPRPGDGAVLAARFGAGWEASAGFFRPVGPREEGAYGQVAIAEIRRTWSFAGSGVEARVAGGFWNHRIPRGAVDGPGERDPRGGYVVVEHDWSGAVSARLPGRAFVQFGLAPEVASETMRHLAAGVVLDRLIAGRGDDATGLYVTVVSIRDPSAGGPTAHETVVELFHRFRINAWLAIQPDLQWIPRPAGDPAASDHWLASVRVELSF